MTVSLTIEPSKERSLELLILIIHCNSIKKNSLYTLSDSKNYCKNTPIQNTNFVRDSHGLWPVEYVWFESHISFSRATVPVKIQLQLTWLQIKGSSMRTKGATLKEDVCKSAPRYVECVTNDPAHERKSWLCIVKAISNLGMPVLPRHGIDSNLPSRGSDCFHGETQNVYPFQTTL